VNDPATDSADGDLELERAALEQIRSVHQSHIDKARNMAGLLNEEAVEATEEGIRDIEDADAEADTAVRAALVRQSAERAMHAIKRVNDLEAMGDALAFGHTMDGDGDKLYVGRLSVIDDDEALLVDWRARAAIPFYRATPLDPLGVSRRRHLHYGDELTGDEDELVNYSDEVFDVESLGGAVGLRGEAAILASVTATTSEQMRSVVATIQAEQDAVVRASSKGALVVQGGPGTGKTVVALHRAAYLLYDQRAELSDSGVLIVGPSKEFLGYISNVLPSLGETGVISRTPPALFPGARRGLVESADVAELKGQLAMATLLANTVADRQREPQEGLVVWYGSRRVKLKADELAALFTRARRHVIYNDGAVNFWSRVIDALSAEVYDPSFPNLADAHETFSNSQELKVFQLKHWPTLSPEQALNDLFGSLALLRTAARNTELTESDLKLLYRNRTAESELDQARWSDADIPLLDELNALLGSVGDAVFESDRLAERDASDEFELAAQFDEIEEAEEESEDDEDFGEPGFEIVLD
jgi:DNA helicase IV